MPRLPSSDREAQGRRLERITRDRWQQPGGMRALSRDLGISRATLYSWFRGDTSPDTASLGRLAGLLGLSAAKLLEALEPATSGRHPSAARAIRVRRAAIRDAVAIGRFVGGQHVTWCDADDPVGPQAHRLYDNDYSQMPVRDRGNWAGLLTGEVITRWMAGHTQAGLEMDPRTPIREVLSYAEDMDNFALVSASATSTDVVELFVSRAAQGRPLAAVLVVAAGRPDGDIVGIVTPQDVPRLRPRPGARRPARGGPAVLDLPGRVANGDPMS